MTTKSMAIIMGSPLSLHEANHLFGKQMCLSKLSLINLDHTIHSLFMKFSVQRNWFKTLFQENLVVI